jgi:hypothetical protein
MKNVPNWISYIHNFLWIFFSIFSYFPDLFSSKINRNWEKPDLWDPPVNRSVAQRWPPIDRVGRRALWLKLHGYKNPDVPTAPGPKLPLLSGRPRSATSLVTDADHPSHVVSSHPLRAATVPTSPCSIPVVTGSHALSPSASPLTLASPRAQGRSRRSRECRDVAARAPPRPVSALPSILSAALPCPLTDEVARPSTVWRRSCWATWDSARWPLIVFLFVEYIQICCEVQKIVQVWFEVRKLWNKFHWVDLNLF